MGFFSDLKEDLSQAVNELIPEEAEKEQKDESDVSLDEMLKNIDTIALEETTATEETVPQDIPVEPEVEESKPEESKTEESKGVVDKIMDSYASRTVSDETAMVSGTMIITGDIVSEGSVDVVGCINGNISVRGKLNVTGHINGNSNAAEIFAEGAKITGAVVSEGAVKVGASTVIIGDITATSAVVAGAVKGDIDVRGPVVLDASAIVMGNIKSKSVQINNGAVIEGMCSQCYADVSPTSFFDDYKPEVKKAPKQK